MSIARELRPGSHLKASVRSGKQALERPDRSKVTEADRRVVDSLALDAALAAISPSTHRWDYLLGCTDPKCSVVAVEVHPANAKEAREMVKKRAAARAHLDQEMSGGASRVRRWVWISSGRTTISRTSPEYRLLAKHGIELAGSVLRL